MSTQTTGSLFRLDPVRQCRFNGVTKNQYPSITQKRLLNRHIEFPEISHVSPGAVHISGRYCVPSHICLQLVREPVCCRVITVYGTKFLRNSTVLYGGQVVSDWAAHKAYTWRYYEQTQRASKERPSDEAKIFDSLLNQYNINHNSSIIVDTEIAALLGPTTRLGDEMMVNALLLELFTGGKLNRTMCDILKSQGSGADVSGLFDFSWVNETQLTFITPCQSSIAVTGWHGESYQLLQIRNPNGDASAQKSDVKAEHLTTDELMPALVYTSANCIGTITHTLVPIKERNNTNC